ncbi:MAG: hypothetical protein KH250_06640 [Bifidobacterium longum]|nr:hypothetical protein [Bifidobacterium longum]
MTTPDDIARRIILSMPDPPSDSELADLAEVGLDGIMMFDVPQRFVDLPDGLSEQEQAEADDRLWRFYDHVACAASKVGCGPYFMALVQLMPSVTDYSLSVLMELCNTESLTPRAIEITRDCIVAALRGEARRLGVYCC